MHATCLPPDDLMFVLQVPLMTVAAARNLLEQQPDKYLLVDVRSSEEQEVHPMLHQQQINPQIKLTGMHALFVIRTCTA